jgi:hypothetical protein
MILVDDKLPDMGGLNLAQVPVLLMTLQDSESREAEAQRRHLQLNGCLNKTALLTQLWERGSRRLSHKLRVVTVIQVYHYPCTDFLMFS